LGLAVQWAEVGTDAKGRRLVGKSGDEVVVYLIGLDTVHAIAESLYAEFKEGQYSPPPLLARMVDARLLGRKSGLGFHRYR